MVTDEKPGDEWLQEFKKYNISEEILKEKEAQIGSKELKEKINDLIAKNGTIESVDDWGKRRLAYLINDEAEGYYVFFNFESEPTFPAELERIAKITDGVLRLMVIKK